MTDNTAPKHPKRRGPGVPFAPGQSGNPAGRPKGSRNKLDAAFTDALYQDFLQHGPTVIEAVRKEQPAQYMRVVASVLPKEVKIDKTPVSELSDDELARLREVARAMASGQESARDGMGEAPTTH